MGPPDGQNSRSRGNQLSWEDAETRRNRVTGQRRSWGPNGAIRRHARALENALRTRIDLIRSDHADAELDRTRLHLALISLDKIRQETARLTPLAAEGET